MMLLNMPAELLKKESRVFRKIFPINIKSKKKKLIACNILANVYTQLW